MGFVGKIIYVAGLFSFFLFSSFSWGSVEDFSSHPINVRLFSESPDLKFTFSSLVNEGQAGVEYKPNVGTPSGIGLSYAGLIGFSYITQVNEEKVTDDKGKTSYDDYRFTFAFNQFLIGVDYLEYEGFFINNTDVIDPSSSEEFIRRPDLNVKNLGARFIWVFNPDDYSLPNILDQTSRQKSDGGSWMIGSNYTQFEFSADSSVIPSSVHSNFGVDASLFKGRFSTVSVTGGYGYTWVWSGKYYIGLMALIGTGIQTRSYDTANGKTTDTGRVEKFDARLALGYHGDRFFIGAYSEADTTKFKTESIEIKSELLNFNIFIGMRF